MKTKTKKTTKLNKSAWIRKQSKRLNSTEVVAKAKAEGIAITGTFVNTVRARMRDAADLQAATKPRKAAKTPAKKKAPKAKAKRKPAVVVAAAPTKTVHSPKVLNGHANSIQA